MIHVAHATGSEGTAILFHVSCALVLRKSSQGLGGKEKDTDSIR